MNVRTFLLASTVMAAILSSAAPVASAHLIQECDGVGVWADAYVLQLLGGGSATSGLACGSWQFTLIWLVCANEINCHTEG